MLKMFVFWLLLQPLYFIAHSSLIGTLESCDCSAVTNLQKTGETTTSFSFSWIGHIEAISYEVWYVREDDGYTSSVVATAATVYTFNNLLPGQYTFYVRSVCDGGVSCFIGIEDIIES